MDTYDVIVIGSATVGGTAAAALARLGLEVALVDRRAPPQQRTDAELDPRVVAVSPGSQRLLEAIGAWSALDPQRLAPYSAMQVRAGHGRLDFTANEHGLSRLGWIAELPELDRAAAAAAQAARRVETLWPRNVKALRTTQDRVEVELDDGRLLTGHILLGADGARSRVRAHAGIAVDSHHYNQKALVAHLVTARPNPGIAWQRFGALGPLALLPLPGGRSSLVWSVHLDQAERLMRLDDEDFAAEIETHAADAPFGKIAQSGPRHALTLVRRQSRQLAAGRVALLGDAARSVHPLAGQGLNLGLGDVAVLVEVIAGWKRDRDPSAILARYGRRRRSDSILVAGGIHGFNEIRALGEPGRQAMALGFGALARLRPARDIFVNRACGLAEVGPALQQLENGRE
ncbi:MAG: 2-octaprenyl-3-methyl-6-methoxy-1,4-benzoquinol hydroxylase [Gammaproteobacteria bacterium HGW-Gammaproteobacteria-8]|nr:MAG: 2-octaprenyl-3-methyl-6-methoxy-1,4-benzoquinol hydroxylase [Gammaproteobacteria bacterium HGW-Gammaproteobacteria-8]